MNVLQSVVAFDTADLDAESAFWATLLGGTVQADDDWHIVSVDGVARICFQLAPNHVPPQWPDGPQHQQGHMDVYVDDMAAAHALVLANGATLLRESEDPNAAEGFQVYADPAGHPFCLCWG